MGFRITWELCCYKDYLIIIKEYSLSSSSDLKLRYFYESKYLLNYSECLAIPFHFFGGILRSVDLVSECLCGAPDAAYAGQMLTIYCAPDTSPGMFYALACILMPST